MTMAAQSTALPRSLWKFAALSGFFAFLYACARLYVCDLLLVTCECQVVKQVCAQ